MNEQPTIRNNVSLRAYNTFNIDAKAEFFIEGSKPEDLIWTLNNFPLDDIMLLGCGSNVLFTKDLKALFHIAMKGIDIVGKDEDFVYVKVAAGEIWLSFVEYCITRNWGGLENLSLIPGQVGTAPVQNIGAYGVEVKDFIEEVEFISMPSGSWNQLKADQCRFGYRNSIFKEELKGVAAIMSVTFKLRLNPVPNTNYISLREQLEANSVVKPSIADVATAVVQIRRSKLPDPAIIGNAGSFFKNPIIDNSIIEAIQKEYGEAPVYRAEEGKSKIAAGWLIEKAGWKGYRTGDAGVHAKQALVLVNHGEASGQEILGLAREIQMDIYNKFGISLEMEVNVV